MSEPTTPKRREPVYREFRPELARLIQSVRGTLRTVIEANGNIEIAHPHLEPCLDVAYYNTFRVTAPGTSELGDFVGMLLVSGGGYMMPAARGLGKVYRIGPSFRVDPERRSNILLEFSSIHVQQEGTLTQLQALAEEMLKSVLAAARPVAPAWKAVLETIRFPITRITHSEAAKLVGIAPELDLSQAKQMEVLDKLGVPCVFMTHNPPTADAYAAFHARRNGLSQNFELIARWGGETLAGAEYETDETRLREQLSTSRLLKRAVELGTPAEDYAALAIKYMTMKDVPISTMYIGLERMVQFIGGIEQARDATLYPVTLDFLLTGKQ
jgi:aspartyl/asparaginyl-tRNA synthetase